MEKNKREVVEKQIRGVYLTTYQRSIEHDIQSLQNKMILIKEMDQANRKMIELANEESTLQNNLDNSKNVV
jgi:hypothetical protein